MNLTTIFIGNLGHSKGITSIRRPLFCQSLTAALLHVKMFRARGSNWRTPDLKSNMHTTGTEPVAPAAK